MDRDNMTTRAARSHAALACAATVAVVFAVSAAPAAAASCDLIEGSTTPLICGTVSSGGEPVAGVNVVIKGHSDQIAETSQCADAGQPCGFYTFVPYNNFNLPAGDYTLCAVPNGDECGDSAPIEIKVDVDGTWQVKDPESGLFVSSVRIDLELFAEMPLQSGPGTGTPGYWKNHPEAWPSAGVTVGGVLYQDNNASSLSINDAIKLMGKVSGDKTYTMFSSLLAAKLNGLIGNDQSCIVETIAKADAWMTVNYVGKGIKASWAQWTVGEPWHQEMDDYNNGKLCAPHRN